MKSIREMRNPLVPFEGFHGVAEWIVGGAIIGSAIISGVMSKGGGGGGIGPAATIPNQELNPRETELLGQVGSIRDQIQGETDRMKRDAFAFAQKVEDGLIEHKQRVAEQEARLQGVLDNPLSKQARDLKVEAFTEAMRLITDPTATDPLTSEVFRQANKVRHEELRRAGFTELGFSTPQIESDAAFEKERAIAFDVARRANIRDLAGVGTPLENIEQANRRFAIGRFGQLVNAPLERLGVQGALRPLTDVGGIGLRGAQAQLNPLALQLATFGDLRKANTSTQSQNTVAQNEVSRLRGILANQSNIATQSGIGNLLGIGIQTLAKSYGGGTTGQGQVQANPGGPGGFVGGGTVGSPIG